jgi:hypothetical protein
LQKKDISDADSKVYDDLLVPYLILLPETGKINADRPSVFWQKTVFPTSQCALVFS